MLWLTKLFFFDQPVKSSIKTPDSIWKIETGQGDNYITGCLLDHNYFKNYYNLITIDLSKQQAFDADSKQKAIQLINFIENLGPASVVTMFFITEEAKETIWLRTVKIL